MPDPVEKPAFGMLDPDEFASHPRFHDGDSNAALTLDLPCRTCGYNLRGLSPHGLCPECQTPVDRALHGDLLRYCEPRWVRTVAHGLRMLNLAIIVGLVVMLVVSLFARAAGMPWVTSSLMLAVGVLAILGAWLATEREPAVAERESLFSTRRLVRVLVIAAVMLEIGDDWIVPPWRFGASVMHLTGAATWLAAIAVAFRYAMSLARRIPDPELLTQTRSVMWGLIFSWGLMGVITAAAVSSFKSPVLAMVFGLSCTILIACVVFTLWSLTLIARYASALSAAADDAQTTWLHTLGRREAARGEPADS